MNKIFFFLFLLVSFNLRAELFPEDKLLKEDALKSWAKRDDQESLKDALRKLQKIQDASDLETLTYLAQGYFLLGDLHQEKSDEKKDSFKKSHDYGVKGLSTNADFKAKLEKGTDLAKALDPLTEREASPLFWAGVALGRWASEEGFFAKVKHKDTILAMMRKVEKLKPSIYHGGLERFWANFYALAPSVAGGDIKKSKEYFEKAVKAAPEYLGSKVLFAEVYHKEKGDGKAFKKELEEVLASPNGPEDITPENIMWKKRAEKLLKQQDELF